MLVALVPSLYTRWLMPIQIIESREEHALCCCCCCCCCRCEHSVGPRAEWCSEMTQKLGIVDLWMLDVGLPICEPLRHTMTSSSQIVALSSSSSYLNTAKILLGACHEIYVRLTALNHRTQDRHSRTPEKNEARCESFHALRSSRHCKAP